jgi:8-amino-7-oxononanoate synthase
LHSHAEAVVGGRRGHGWVDRWLRMVEVADGPPPHPMVDAVIEEIDGRRIRIGQRWLDDFASCNYLALDLDREVIEAIPGYLDDWGVHPSWSRLLGSPVLYEQIEMATCALLGAADVLALPTLTHIHQAVIPALAAEGHVYVDARGHKTMYDGCVAAKARGATLVRFRHDDPGHLEELLRASGRRPGRRGPRLICIDGVNSMTGNPPELEAFARIAREHDALLYIDDAHGFGVIGERDRYEPNPYGRRGNAVVRHVGESYENIVLTAGFSKAYSSLLAFVACPTPVKRALKLLAPPYLYSGPSPVASLASVLAGLAVNERRGDELRSILYERTKRLLDHLKKLGVLTPNRSGLPIVEIPLRDPADVDRVGRQLFERGIYVTLAAWPLVPGSEAGFRIQVTAANSPEQIDHLIDVLQELSDSHLLRPRQV